MLLRRHRAILPDVDLAFNKTPRETMDPAFTDPNPADGGERVEDAPESFDPADFNVDRVIEYLKHATPEDRAAILEQEQAGKARKGILEWTSPEPSADENLF